MTCASSGTEARLAGFVAAAALGLACGQSTSTTQKPEKPPRAGAPSSAKAIAFDVERLPSVEVPFARDVTLTLDGVFDEPVWKLAQPIGPFVDVGSGKVREELPLSGFVRLAHDDAYLYVGFTILDDDVRGGFPAGAKDPHLWERDTAEIMIDPEGDGDNKDYFEIQINPQNLVFDSRFDDYNSPRPTPSGPFGHEDWSAKVESQVRIHGTLDDATDTDIGYDIEARIPWSSLATSAAPDRKAPKAGTFRMNFYAMQDNGGVAWSPILGQGNFHKASRFGRVTFAMK